MERKNNFPEIYMNEHGERDGKTTSHTTMENMTANGKNCYFRFDDGCKMS